MLSRSSGQFPITGGAANGRRRGKRARKAYAAFREAVSARVLGMEEPLRHAAQFVGAIEIAHRPEDDEMEAFAFVVSEAYQRLEFVNAELQALFRDIRAAS